MQLVSKFRDLCLEAANLDFLKMSNSFGSLNAGSSSGRGTAAGDFEHDFSSSSFHSAIGSVSVPIVGACGLNSAAASSIGAPSPINSRVSNRTASISLGMFDMEGIDDVNEDDGFDAGGRDSFRFSDDEGKYSQEEDEVGEEGEEAREDSEDNEDNDDDDDDVQHAEAAEETIVGSLHVGSYVHSSYINHLENEENEEKISNLPIKINNHSSSSMARRGSRLQQRRTSSKTNENKLYAQSLPITIPNWKPLNNHQIVEDNDLDWVSEEISFFSN